MATDRFCTLNHELLKVGDHAGLSETHWVLAFRPDLVDLARLAEGELDVRRTGILHCQPRIEGKYNPRNVSKAVADQLRKNVVDNFIAYVQAEVKDFMKPSEEE